MSPTLRDKMTDAERVSEAEWLAAVGEARLRVRFDADPQVKAARKAYKQALVRGSDERIAWKAADDVYRMIRAELQAKLAACVDKETF